MVQPSLAIPILQQYTESSMALYQWLLLEPEHVATKEEALRFWLNALIRKDVSDLSVVLFFFLIFSSS